MYGNEGILSSIMGVKIHIQTELTGRRGERTITQIENIFVAINLFYLHNFLSRLDVKLLMFYPEKATIIILDTAVVIVS